jgi:hypothetical protein
MKTVFSDEVVQVTELKRNQRYWLDRARKTGGVTIVQGKLADLVLVPRQAVAENAQVVHYAKMMSQFFLETVKSDRELKNSVVFPWFKDLDEEDRQEFYRELVETFAECMATGRWDVFDELLEDWQATAEAGRNQELLEAWHTRGRAEDYIPLEVVGADKV